MRPTFNPPPTSRRAMLATTAIVAPAAALAACGLVTPANVATVESVIAKIQAVMPYVSGVANVIGGFPPAVSSIVAGINAGLSTAQGIFSTMTTAMTTATAQPVVGKIVTYIQAAYTSAVNAVPQLPASVQAGVNNLLGEVSTVIGDLNSFVNPIAAPVSAAPMAPGVVPPMPTLPTHLFIRT